MLQRVIHSPKVDQCGTTAADVATAAAGHALLLAALIKVQHWLQAVNGSHRARRAVISRPDCMFTVLSELLLDDLLLLL